ncbi:pericentriolar material 1 protein isoform X5 [Nothobranchius furzeri]|uniref:pericentriolar material 1 protein isoform X5 n=1 Tax=Nothobranchius furzeri TaxID=105023 RepID=UPI002403B184|nr:pericentriolar material 1 protein isoform X5 [Nothobranchius furzeri]
MEVCCHGNCWSEIGHKCLASKVYREATVLFAANETPEEEEDRVILELTLGEATAGFVVLLGNESKSYGVPNIELNPLVPSNGRWRQAEAVGDMATGGPVDDPVEELHNWTVTNGSLEDRLNNMDWGIQQKKPNRSSENKKKLSASVVESRLTNDISPESTPGAGRRKTRTPHSFPHIKYSTQMSVPEQAELDKLRQRINFTDLDERSIGSDSQGRVTAANNQRQLAGENRKPHNYLPLHVNTNKSKEPLLPSASAPTTPAITKEIKKQSPGFRDLLTLATPVRDSSRLAHSDSEQGLLLQREHVRGEPRLDSSQVVSKLVQIRDYISKARSMRDYLVEKNDVPANVERLSLLIEHLKEQEKSYLRFLQTMLAQQNDGDGATLVAAVGSGSLESASLNAEVRSLDTSNTTGDRPEAVCADQREELENLRKQHELLKKMLEQQEQLRALQGRQEALMAMQRSAEHALAVIEDAVVTETTNSVSGLSVTSELNDELNELIQRFHKQLHDSQTKAVPDNRHQARSLSLSREVGWPRTPHVVGPPQHRPLLHSASGPHTGLDTDTTAASAKLTKLQELQDKKQTMDKILRELHSLRDQTLNNNSCRGLSALCSSSMEGSSDCPSVLCSNGAMASTSFQPLPTQRQDGSSSNKLRKLKEVHKRLNELRELVQYYEQTSDMMVDAVNENVKEVDDEEEEDETEDGSMFETIFDSEQENRQHLTNIRNPQRSRNWADLNSLTNGRSVRASTTNNRNGRLNTECEINNRTAANLRSLNVATPIECQYNRDQPYDQGKDEDEEDDYVDNDEGAQALVPDSVSESSRRSSLGNDAELTPKLHRQTAKQKLRQLQELVAMVQSDDTDGTTANEDEALHQQPNNTRAPISGTPVDHSKKSPRDVARSSKAREKLYEEKLRQQKQELKQLHEERQRLIEIQGKIQDLQWACPDLQSSVSSTVSQQGLLRTAPVAVSSPAPIKAVSSSGPKTNLAVLKATAAEAASSSVNDNEQLWSEMRRGQMLREDLRQRRMHLESLMAEQQRRSGLCDSPCQAEDQEDNSVQPLNRDERTMATWGSSSDHLDDDDENADDEYRSEICAEEEEEQEECTESSSDDDVHVFSPGMNQCSHCNRKNQGSNLKPPAAFSGESCDHLHNKTQVKQQSRPSNQSPSQHGSIRRQENLRWPSELSFVDGTHHFQEQISQLQKQLDFSTSMCQTLLQDQQTLSYMLQTLLTGQNSLLPNNLSSPQVQLVMHQLNQCYTQLAWQQNNVQRLKQVLNDLIHQQQSSAAGWQTQKRVSAHESSPGPSASPGVFHPYSSTLHPSAINTMSPALSPFPPSFNLHTPFPTATGDSFQGAAGPAAPECQKLQLDPNTSVQLEYMSFPPPLQRSPLNTATERGPAVRLNTSYTKNITRHHAPKMELSESPTSSPVFAKRHSRQRAFDKESQGSFSSIPDPVDSTTVTKAFKAGCKASAQANLASRSKTPKNRRRRSKGHKNMEGPDSESVSSSADFAQERAAMSHHREQNQRLLEKLTQEKLDSKAKLGNKRNDLSSDASSDFSLFEALRETIYSEVASLISQNESRPHFLIELFHELQLLNTDYLRQRALFCLQDLVTKHLAMRSAAEEPLPSLGPAVWTAGSQSELTPSQSLVTSDEEVVEKNLRHVQELKRKGDTESVDNDSNMSTSSILEPFANDDLGNTVIHFGNVVRIREYERMKLKAGFNHCNASAAGVNTSEASNAERASANPAEPVEGAAAGDVHCPQIDTQQLDRQIKAIMTEVIPFLKENMNEVCSHQLLTSVRRMVLTLTQQNDDSKEFVRFFHKQLGGILQESLSKFEGRTLKDCGEDLLVEISEILFNELAFFKLMQDLDSSSCGSTPAARQRHQTEKPSKTNHISQENAEGGTEKSISPATDDEDKDQDEAEKEGSATIQEHFLQMELKSSDASEMEEEEDEGQSQGAPLSINLSKAETQALTDYGSGEDENDEEEMEEFEAGPVDVQTSLQVSADGQVEQNMATNSSEIREIEPEQNYNEINKSEEAVVDSTLEEHPDVERQNPEEDSELEVAAATEEPPAGGPDVPKESVTTSSPDTDSPVLVSVDEMGSGNTSQRSDEEDFVKVDDLPLQLTVMCEEQLQKRIVEEQQNNNLSVEILNGNPELATGLVGNAQMLKEPETTSAQIV